LIYKVNNESYDDLVVGISDKKDNSCGKICKGKISGRFYLLWSLIAAIILLLCIKLDAFCWPPYFAEVIF